MKRKILLFFTLCLLCLFFTGCRHEHDKIEVWNKSDWIFDNIQIETMDGYFYDHHEKFTVDENKIGVTIYFSKEDAAWDD